MHTFQQRHARELPVWHDMAWFPWVRQVVLVAIVIICTLTVFYWIEFDVRYTVGVGASPLHGGYGDEHSGNLRYRYTDGNTLLMIPQVGAAPQIVTLKLAGPNLSQPRPVQLAVAGRRLVLGEVRDLRVYHILAPTDEQGTLRLRITGPTAPFAADKRELGALITQANLRSPAATLPPAFAVLSALFVCTLVIGGLAPVRVRTSGWLACGVALAVATSIGLARGHVEFPPLWWQLGLTAFVMTLAAVLRSGWFAKAQPLALVGAVFGFWRVGLWLVAAFGIWFSDWVAQVGALLTRDGNDYDRSQVIWDTLVQGWVQWDSEHYSRIARSGYTFQGVRWPNIAFFPLYPLLINLLAPVTANNVGIAGVLLSNVALIAALYLLYDLVVRDFGRITALFTLVFVLCIPTAVFYVALYSESLALLLTVAAVWALRRERWWLAGAAGMVLTLTRVPGIFIAPVLALCYLQACGWRWRMVRWSLLAAGLPPLGLLGFMAFQWSKFGTPFAFMQAQAAWENALSPPWVLPMNLWTMLTTKPAWPNTLFQVGFYLLFVALIAIALRRLPLAYGLTTALLLLPPLLSSWTWSVSRHMLIGIGAYIVLAQWADRPWRRWALLAGMLPLLILTTLLFVNGWWIA